MIMTLLILFLGLAFFTKMYFIPKYKINKLKNELESKGLKVKVDQFYILGFSIGEQIKQSDFNLDFLQNG